MRAIDGRAELRVGKEDGEGIGQSLSWGVLRGEMGVMLQDSLDKEGDGQGPGCGLCDASISRWPIRLRNSEYSTLYKPRWQEET